MKKPQRLNLVNANTLERIAVQFNPKTLNVSTSVNYARQQVLGSSYQPLQYTNTSNPVFRLELYTMLGTSDFYGLKGKELMRNHENFFQALCYPGNSNTGIVRAGAPAKCLIVWPNYLSMKVAVLSHASKATKFNTDLEPIIVTHTLSVEESRDSRITADEVRNIGYRRHADRLEGEQEES